MEDESKQTPMVGRRAKVHGDTGANGRGRNPATRMMKTASDAADLGCRFAVCSVYRVI
jgi:hypothetical protein